VHFSSAHPGRDHPEPSPEELQAWHRKMGPPDNELPGAVPFHAVLAKTDDLVVAVVGVDAHSTGMSIKIAVRLRRSDPSLHGLDPLPYGPGGGGPFLVGVAYPDGRTASNVSSQRLPDPFTPGDAPSLVGRGGGGGGRTFEMDYWLTPMPPPGDLTIIVAWPTRDIPESRTVIPGDAIAQGVSANVELWPWQPPEHDEPPPPPKPVLPEGGWFAQQAGDDPTDG
jgi:hypothetical protein